MRVTQTIMVLFLIIFTIGCSTKEELHIKGTSKSWKADIRITITSNKIQYGNLQLKHQGEIHEKLIIKGIKIFFPDETRLNKEINYPNGYQLDSNINEYYVDLKDSNGQLSKKYSVEELRGLFTNGSIEINWISNNSTETEMIQFLK